MSIDRNTEWRKVLLRDLCSKIQYGYTEKASTVPIGPKFLRITDIVPETINWEEVPYCIIPEDKYKKYLLTQGDIVIARTGATTGYAKYLKHVPYSVFASYLVRLQIRGDVDSRYIGFIVESNSYKDFIKQNIGGSAQPNANAQILTSYPLCLPNYDTQRKIAAILSAYDNLIENNLRRIKILEEMAQKLYREWFVNFRFPGHENTRFVDSSLGKIPEGWEVKKLKDVVALNYGKALKKTVRRDGDVAVYGSSGIVGFHDNHLVKGPGIIVGRKGNVGSVFWSNENFYPIDTVYYVTSTLPLHFMYYELQNKNFINNDAAVPGLNRSQAYSLELIVPTDSILSKFCSMADSFSKQTNYLKKKNTNLHQTRDLLLPKLISGEVDVSELDINMPEDAIV